jgi:hypothetical protein
MSLSKSHSLSAVKPRPGRRGGFGIEPLSDAERRRHIVKVLLNDDELDQVDSARGSITRSEYLRSSAVGKLRPQPVPETTRQALFILSKVAGNLATLAVAARAGEYVAEEKILDGIRAFRTALFANFETEVEE